MVSFFSRILDLISPRACPLCGNRLSPTEETLCAPCNMQLPRTGYALQPTDNEMARLFWGHFPLERAIAWVRFEPHSQVAQLFYDLKYHHHPEYGEQLGYMLAKEVSDDNANTPFFDGIDAIVPIPLERRREHQRGYNQSLMVARGINRYTDIPIVSHVIKRISFTESQTRKDWWERQANVAEAFQLVKPDLIRGKHLLLVDDIVTTGATITACAKELFQAEGIRISVLTVGFTKT